MDFLEAKAKKAKKCVICYCEEHISSLEKDDPLFFYLQARRNLLDLIIIMSNIYNIKNNIYFSPQENKDMFFMRP